MPGRGQAPKVNRRGRDPLIRGAWRSASGTGWQHGKVPAPPAGLHPEAVRAWRAWFDSWFAAHWVPGDLPGLRLVVRLYDQVVTGRYTRAGELRLWSDNYGISPKGQQDRRWLPPLAPGDPASPVSINAYSHLRSQSTEGDPE